MRKKLLSFQNMKAMNMEQSNRRKNGDRKVELIEISQYRQKLEALLEKLTIQTRYTNRVTQCNLRNIQELEQVKKELNHLLELRKIEQKNEAQLKNLSNELAQTLVQTQEKLVFTTNEMFEMKKEIKQYKKEIAELKKAIEKLQMEKKVSQREKYHSMIELYDKEDNKLLSTLIEDYVKEVKHPSSIVLYRHCLETLKSRSFNGFLKGLEVKMNALEIQNKDTLRLKEADQLQIALSRRKHSNLSMVNSGVSEQSKYKSSVKRSSVKFPSFHLKTEGSYSQPKYSVF